MDWRPWQRGFFEGLPRLAYRLTGARYIDACAIGMVLNGAVIALLGVIAVALYVDVDAGEALPFAAAWAAAFAVEGAVAGAWFRREAAPVRQRLDGTQDGASAALAWDAAARAPLWLARRPLLHLLGAGAAAIPCLVLGERLGLPAQEAALLLPACYLIYLASTVLRYIAMEIGMRPLLADLGTGSPTPGPAPGARDSLHRRLLATIPVAAWGSAFLSAGLLTADRRDFETAATAALVSLAVTLALSAWLSWVLADAVSGPISDLRDAARRVGRGDLEVRVPVVSTDETGELAGSFNAMVAGLQERERLREAFGTFLDPHVAERVLREGTDLRGEEVEATVLVLDVRGFTEFAAGTPAQEVVSCLNQLFEAVIPVIGRHGGHATTFAGDSLLALFGAPERHRDHARRAVAAGREIARLVRTGAGGRLQVGIGISTGLLVAGTIGGGGRRDFTAIGDPVNTAARVEAATRLTGDDLLISEETLRALGPEAAGFLARPAMTLKGKQAPVTLYAASEAAPGQG